MTKLNQESGRSMVEMLGVLAIIGVLSIGGIAGYTMAMNRFRANEILNYASQASILAQTANAGNGANLDNGDIRTQLGLSAGGNEFQGAEIAAAASGTITLTNVQPKIADSINSIMGVDVCNAGTCTYCPTTREAGACAS